ncbi:MAG: AI-2E family transporter, partial [Mobilitalea sp.]
IISSLFFAIDSDKIESYIKMKFPNKINVIVIEAKAFAVNIGPKYVKGYFILMCVTFLELSLGLLLLKVKGSILLAALIAILDILPLIGTGGVVIPWIIISFINGNSSLALGLLVLYLIITIVRNILEPKIVGAQIGLHPLIMLISMFIGAKIFGFSGMIALPVGVVVLKHLYDNGKLHF